MIFDFNRYLQLIDCALESFGATEDERESFQEDIKEIVFDPHYPVPIFLNDGNGNNRLIDVDLVGFSPCVVAENYIHHLRTGQNTSYISTLLLLLSYQEDGLKDIQTDDEGLLVKPLNQSSTHKESLTTEMMV